MTHTVKLRSAHCQTQSGRWKTLPFLGTAQIGKLTFCKYSCIYFKRYQQSLQGTSLKSVTDFLFTHRVKDRALKTVLPAKGKGGLFLPNIRDYFNKTLMDICDAVCTAQQVQWQTWGLIPLQATHTWVNPTPAHEHLLVRENQTKEAYRLIQRVTWPWIHST